ncbi:MAG: type VII toxin-antitoxin system MntA family adenylyltransferase antitoxin [Candidatus Rokuibacteriota bacterium]
MSKQRQARDLQAEAERTLRESAGPGLVSAYLFGSHARGTAHRESDVDIAVLLAREHYPDADDRFEARVTLTSSLTAALGPGYEVDLVVLNDAPPTLARRIVVEGRRILCADAAKDHDFVRDAQLRAADLAPFLRRTARVKLAAIRR